MSVGQRIADRRTELGLSRKDLVRLTGLSYPYVSQLENDDRTPTLATLQKLAQALGLPVEALLGEDRNPVARTMSFANPAYAADLAAGAAPAPAMPPPDPAALVLEALASVPLDHRLAVLADVTTVVVRDLARDEARARRR